MCLVWFVYLIDRLIDSYGRSLFRCEYNSSNDYRTMLYRTPTPYLEQPLCASILLTNHTFTTAEWSRWWPRSRCSRTSRSGASVCPRRRPNSLPRAGSTTTTTTSTSTTVHSARCLALAASPRRCVSEIDTPPHSFILVEGVVRLID